MRRGIPKCKKEGLQSATGWWISKCNKRWLQSAMDLGLKRVKKWIKGCDKVECKLR